MRNLLRPFAPLMISFLIANPLGAAPVASGTTEVRGSAIASLPVQPLPNPAGSSWANTAFEEGEEFRYAIKWGAITGGYSTLTVPNIEMVEGRPAYHLLSEARSTGIVDTFYRVRDRNEAWLDRDIPRTLRYQKHQREGKYKADETVVLNHDTQRFHLKQVRLDKNNRVEEKEGAIPPNVLDVFGSLYYLRTQPLEVGKSFTIDVQTGSKVWPLVVNVTKREKVKVKAGKFDCFKVEPQLREPGLFISKGKKLEVWMTADNRHMPVLMRSEIFIGHVSAELTQHRYVHPSASIHVSSMPTDSSTGAE